MRKHQRSSSPQIPFPTVRRDQQQQNYSVSYRNRIQHIFESLQFSTVMTTNDKRKTLGGTPDTLGSQSDYIIHLDIQPLTTVQTEVVRCAVVNAISTVDKRISGEVCKDNVEGYHSDICRDGGVHRHGCFQPSSDGRRVFSIGVFICTGKPELCFHCCSHLAGIGRQW